MADSDGGSDAGSDGDYFEPKADLDKLTEKQKKKRIKDIQKWRVFMDFLFRHVAIATFKYNVFETENLTNFLKAMDTAEHIRSTIKLKKGEEPRIGSLRTMKDSAELLHQRDYLQEAKIIRTFLDVSGRMKGLGMIGTSFFKALKKGKVRGLDKIKYYVDFWKGFCIRTYDYGQLAMRGVDPDSLSELEKRFLPWACAAKTAINLSQKFLRRASEATGLDLMSDDPATIQKHMQAAEFVLATKMEEMLFERVRQETKSFLLGTPLQQAEKSKNYDLPELVDIDLAWVQPIRDDAILLQLPEEPPKDKKKGKKGKKGKGGPGGSKKKKKKK